MDDERPVNNPAPPPPHHFWSAILTGYRDIVLIVLGSGLSLIGSCIGTAAQESQWRQAQEAERTKRVQDRAMQVFEDVARVLNPVDFHARVLANEATTPGYEARSAAFLAAADSFRMAEPRITALVEAYFDAPTAEHLKFIGKRLDLQKDWLDLQAQRLQLMRRREEIQARLKSLPGVPPAQRAASDSTMLKERQAIDSANTFIASEVAWIREMDERFEAILAARIRDGMVGYSPVSEDSLERDAAARRTVLDRIGLVHGSPWRSAWLVGWLACAVLVTSLTRDSRLPRAVWLLLGLIAGPLALVAILVTRHGRRVLTSRFFRSAPRTVPGEVTRR